MGGPAVEGSTLTTTNGAFSGGAVASYSYQWLLCSASGEGCQPLGGATGASVVLTSADVGHTLRAQVVATNAAGSASETSAPSALVAQDCAQDACAQPAPRLTALSLAHHSFAPFPSGPVTRPTSRKEPKQGTVVSYDDSEAGTTTFEITEQAHGHEHGKSCSTSAHKGKPCTTSKVLATFTHADVAGSNSFVLTGVAGRRALPVGTYTLRAVPRSTSGSGSAVTVSFSVRRRA